ncbi:MAG: phage head-tail connector protein [Clostridiales bacterium]|nr:phage head-tail connector protein [Clostridiales bacterium]
MIASLSEIKTMLRIESDDTEYDDYISAIIEPLQLWIQEVLDNDFVSDRVVNESTAFEFVNSTNKILDPDSYFVEYQFQAGKDIQVAGSFNNDGIYTVDTAEADALTVGDSYSLVDEDCDGHNYMYSVIIAQKDYPKGLKSAFAKMVGFNIKNTSFKPEDNPYSSESFANYSYNTDRPFIIKSSGDYPQHIMDDLFAYKSKRIKLR